MGIDYGMGTTNIDKATGIRYGVIPANDVCQSWADSSEADYGPPYCPKCGNSAVDCCDVNDDENALQNIPPMEEWKHNAHECADYACEQCEYVFGSESAFGEEAIAWTLDDGEYMASQSGADHDIFVLKSPYYTRGPFCSPCAPGAVYLRDGSEEGQAKAYCFDHSWFDEGRAPYPVYRVSDDAEVMPEKSDVVS
jgi:hypothetical protein